MGPGRGVEDGADDPDMPRCAVPAFLPREATVRIFKSCGNPSRRALPSTNRSDLEIAMRYEQTSFKVLALLTAVTILGACGGQETPPMEEAAPAEAAPPPSPESFTLVAEDGGWSADIAPAGIVFRHRRNDSLTFAFKEPTVTGAISDYEVLTTGDKTRLTISMATAKCTDKQGTEYTHMVQVWLTGEHQLTSKGCANRKM